MRSRIFNIALILLVIMILFLCPVLGEPVVLNYGGLNYSAKLSEFSPHFDYPAKFVAHGLSAQNTTVVKNEEEESVSADASSGPPFPRLGMWWLNPDSATSKAIARYDLLLQEFDEAEYIQKLKQVRAINPDIKIFRPISPTEQSWNYNGINPLIKNLPSGFFVTALGTRLAKPISKTQTKIQVRSLTQPDGSSKFSVGGTIVIGKGESAKVLGIDKTNKILTVKRGFIRPAASHAAGEYVASHVTFWPETWVMNVASTCPKVKVSWVDTPVNWVELYHSLLVTKKIPGLEWNGDYINQAQVQYNGIIIDRFEDRESWLLEGEDGGTLLDLYHNNTRVSRTVFDTSWKKGVDYFRTLLKKSYPGLSIIRNNPISLQYQSYNGQVYEESGWTKPTSSWWKSYFAKTDISDYYRNGCYLDWFKFGSKPLYVMVEVYQDESFPGKTSSACDVSVDAIPLNYKRMRFSLTSTLLGDGYYSYELSTSTHGSGGLFWFDEYNNAGKGKGYLGYPTGSAVKLSSGVYKRKFDNGLVLVNPQSKMVKVTLDRPYKRITGIQVPTINDGKVSSVVNLAAWDGIILLNLN